MTPDLFMFTAGENLCTGVLVRMTKKGTVKRIKAKGAKKKGHLPIGVAVEDALKDDKVMVLLNGGIRWD